MRFKLDENFGTRTLKSFVQFGHDTETVLDEGLGGVDDLTLFQRCRDENRCLVTLDLDFTDVTRFPLNASGGVVVLRVPRNPSRMLMTTMVERFLTAIGESSPERSLWIVEVDRIRIHQKPDF